MNEKRINIEQPPSEFSKDDDIPEVELSTVEGVEEEGGEPERIEDEKGKEYGESKEKLKRYVEELRDYWKDSRAYIDAYLRVAKNDDIFHNWGTETGDYDSSDFVCFRLLPGKADEEILVFTESEHRRGKVYNQYDFSWGSSVQKKNPTMQLFGLSNPEFDEKIIEKTEKVEKQVEVSNFFGLIKSTKIIIENVPYKEIEKTLKSEDVVQLPDIGLKSFGEGKEKDTVFKLKLCYDTRPKRDSRPGPVGIVITGPRMVLSNIFKEILDNPDLFWDVIEQIDPEILKMNRPRRADEFEEESKTLELESEFVDQGVSRKWGFKPGSKFDQLQKNDNHKGNGFIVREKINIPDMPYS